MPQLVSGASNIAKPRIPSLDIIRGIAILGVLAVNADGFAIPIRASLNPDRWPFPNEGATAVAYWVMDAFFHDKFVAIFSMLFGISLFLVGGEVNDRQRGVNLARRLIALIGFALLHGFGFWWGDILSTYAVAGIIMFACRSCPPRVLLPFGALILAVTFGLDISSSRATHDMPAGLATAHGANVAEWRMGPQVSSDLAQARSSMAGAYVVNATTYLHQLSRIPTGLPTTVGLMMLGLGLFKLGFFAGRFRASTYARLVALGGMALAPILAMSWSADVENVRGPWAHIINMVGSPLVAVGYMSSVMLLLQGRAATFLSPFAATGRMAFTNYLTQSLIMTSVFYGGRGAMMGQLDRPALWVLVVAVWMVQLAWSNLWLTYFDMGPMEWLWRWATYGHRSPFVKPRGMAALVP
jgi:uncharacterized protein